MLDETKFRYSDFVWQRDTWLRLNRPMANRELDAYLGDWCTELAELPYLKVVSKSISYGTDHLLTLRCRSRLNRANMEIAQADLARIWLRDLSEGLEQLHVFRSFTNGFEMQFAGLSRGGFAMSGHIVVEIG